MTRRYLVLSLVGVAALLLGLPGRAAAFEPDHLKVNVPFKFVVGNSVLPAGRYDVRPSTTNPAVVWLVSPNGDHVAALATEWGGASFRGPEPDLRFEVYGGTHFLWKIQIPGEGTRLVALTRDEIQSDLARLAEQRAQRGRS